MVRSALPQNHIIDVPIQYLDFPAHTGWTVDIGAASTDTVNYISGGSAIKCTVTAAGSWGVARRKLVDLGIQSPGDLNNQVGYIWVYLYNQVSEYSKIAIYFMQAGVDSNYAIQELPLSGLVPGWNQVYISPDSWNYYGTASAGAVFTYIKVGCLGATGKTPSATFDALYFGQRGRSNCIIQFDDE